MKSANKYILSMVLVIFTGVLYTGRVASAQDILVNDGRFVTGKTFHSELLGSDQEYAVILPRNYYSTNKQYPVVYMLHGWGDSPISWNDKWLAIEDEINELESSGLEDMIYVFPTGYKSYYCNTFNHSYPYMDMFVQELIPHIDNTYRTIANKSHRAITGYSMGGFGAAAIAIRHPELFCVSAPLSMSFRTDEMYMDEPQDGWSYQWGRIFGGQGTEGQERITTYYKEHCPFYQFIPENKGKLSQVRWFLHCGDDEDRLLIANDDLHVLMRENGYEHEYRVAEGAHTGTYWRYALDEVLNYIQFCMNGGGDWTPVQAQTPIKGETDIVADETNTRSIAIFFIHSGLPKDVLNKIEDRLEKELPHGIVLCCNVRNKSLAKWIKQYNRKYSLDNYTSKLAIAVDAAGNDLYEYRDYFDQLYFDNASLPENVGDIDTTKFWYIGQTDDGKYYKDMGHLYKECRLANAKFQYRVRNGTHNNEKDLFFGIDYIIKLIFY